MTKKQVLRTVAFILVFFTMVFGLCDIFEQENTYSHAQRFHTYRQLEKDTVDAVFVGTSGVDWYWIPSQAYEDYGMTVFPLASPAMPSWLYKTVIQDALRYQSPELFIIDIRSFGQSNVSSSVMEVRGRRVIDALSPFSPYRVSAAFETMKLIHRVDEDELEFDISYLFSVAKYNSKWKDDEFRFKDNIGDVYHNYLGYYVNAKNSVTAKKIKPVKYDADYELELDPISEENLYDLIDFIKKKDLNVLFVETPQNSTKKKMGRYNTVYKILEKEGMPYLHYYTEKSENGISIGLDSSKHFFNAAHVNYEGAKIFTKEFSKYLDENYDFKDRRQDKKAQKNWAGVNDTLTENMKLFKENLNKI